MTQLPALEGHEVVPFASAEDAVSWKPKRR
jgi:hypothetical protein